MKNWIEIFNPNTTTKKVKFELVVAFQEVLFDANVG